MYLARFSCFDLPIHRIFFLLVCLFACLFVYFFAYLFVCLFICLFVCYFSACCVPVLPPLHSLAFLPLITIYVSVCLLFTRTMCPYCPYPFSCLSGPLSRPSHPDRLALHVFYMQISPLHANEMLIRGKSARWPRD